MTDNLKIIEEWKEQAKQKIYEIYAIYKDDPYMISKTNHYITRQLPYILENIKQNHAYNQQRIEDLNSSLYLPQNTPV